MIVSLPCIGLDAYSLKLMELTRSHVAISMVIAQESLSDLFDTHFPLDWVDISMNAVLALSTNQIQMSLGAWHDMHSWSQLINANACDTQKEDA